MCSVQGDGEAVLKKEVVKVSDSCKKCQQKAVALARTKDSFCSECFHTYFTHRFRATFGKSRLIQNGEGVLLAYSGGPSSSVLLELCVEGLRGREHKRLRFNPTVLVIDEGAVLGRAWAERVKTQAEVLSLALQSGFPVLFAPLEQVFGSFQSAIISAEPSGAAQAVPPSLTVDELQQQLRDKVVLDVELERRLSELFAGMRTLTARENLLLSLRHRLLVEVARQHAIGKVLVGDNANRMAVRLLGNIAQGRGVALPLDTGFTDTRVDDVMIVRPLREFPAREVATFVALYNLQTVTIPSITTLAPDNASIERLTESFVSGLQAEFPSTVSTIFRTGDKLSVRVQAASCALCKAPLSDIDDASVFTHLKSSGNTPADVWDSLCYGCRLTVKDMKESSLPLYAVQTRTEMRREIEGFLLDKSD